MLEYIFIGIYNRMKELKSLSSTMLEYIFIGIYNRPLAR
jgi:hypothetical protein